ncbi:limulus clotting factor C [Patella vulgata]|uniref:limulus clotting factor C n=1 Tax=Patella vulgata TaxID=6465 RepID=UPI00218020EC|nr:limulus clotting factor C [Patella vulgata]
MRVGSVSYLLLFSNLITITIARCSPTFESCPCGKTGTDVDIKIIRCSTFMRGVPCRPCTRYSRSQLCSGFENCTNCEDRQAGGCTECGPNKYGRFCEKDCGCLNGGTCTKLGSCTCKSGYVGDHCQAKKVLDCGQPTEPIYGNMVVTNTTEGGVATYSCPENHLLYGPKKRTCSDTGQWSGSTPTCEYTCPVQQPSDHMIMDIDYLSFKLGDFSSDIEIVRTANFRCEEGFSLVGHDTLNCLPGGIWNGKQPKCVQGCPKPPSVDHGDMIGSHFIQGSKVQFKCHQTYRLNGADIIICDKGIWDNPFPICDPEPRCPEVNIPYGEVHYKGNRMIGTEAIILCDFDGILDEKEVRICEDNDETGIRNWSGEDEFCVWEYQEDNDNKCYHNELENGFLKTTVNGSLEKNDRDKNGFVHSDRILYECDDGYYLKGERENFCVDGKLTKEIPLCINVITCPNLVAPKGCSRCFGKHCSTSLKPIADCVPRISDVHIPNDLFPNGTVIEFINDPVLYSLSGSRRRTCQNDGKWSGPETVCEQKCGKPSSSVLVRNKQGIPVRGQWPWQASIYWKTDGHLELKCGGFLIYDEWIVTDAHCVTNAKSENPKDEDVIVSLGHVEKQDVKAPDLQVNTIYPHPDYDFETYESDIALIKLKKTVKFNRWIRPVCLPKSYNASSNMTGVEGVFTGWGGRLPHLKMTKVRIIGQEVCRQFYKERKIDLASDNQFCARVVVSNRSDACRGDSGGPLVIQDKEGRWQAIGMVSWGTGACNSTSGDVDVYTRIQNFIKWIGHITGKEAPP